MRPIHTWILITTMLCLVSNADSQTDPFSTCTSYSSQPNKPINDTSDPEDTISIALGSNFVLTDIDIAVEIHHEFLADLDVKLISPSGTEVHLIQDRCADFDTLIVRFDDDSSALVCDTVTIGVFNPPDGTLADFNNELIDGDWILQIVDDASGDDGTFVRWCLVPQTQAVSCLAPSTLTVSNSTSNSAVLSWQANNIPAETEWEIELVEFGQTPTGIPTHTGITTNPYTLIGINQATAYQYYVRAKCGPVASAWAGPRYFTTSISNPSACPLNISIPDFQCTSLNTFPIEVSSVPGTALGTDLILEEVRLLLNMTGLPIWKYF